MHRAEPGKTEMIETAYTHSLPIFKSKQKGICPWCSTFITEGSTIVRLEQPVRPDTNDGCISNRTGKPYYWDGRQISMTPRQYVHFDCYKKDLIETAQFTDGCHYCNSDEDLTIDHIIATSKGGKDIPSNLTVACRSCNSSKGNRPYNDFINR
jgi:hypothetical protein